MKSELIDRIAFREHLDTVYPFTKSGQREPSYDFAKGVFLAELARFPMSEAAPKWISVEDYLPADGQEVLCVYEYFRYGNYNCMVLAMDCGYFCCGRFGGPPAQGRSAKVLYWMPLPNLPGELT